MKRVGSKGNNNHNNVQFGIGDGSLVPVPTFTHTQHNLSNPIWFLPYGFQRIPPPQLSLPISCSNQQSEFFKNLHNSMVCLQNYQNFVSDSDNLKYNNKFTTTATYLPSPSPSPWLNLHGQYGTSPLSIPISQCGPVPVAGISTTAQQYTTIPNFHQPNWECKTSFGNFHNRIKMINPISYESCDPRIVQPIPSYPNRFRRKYSYNRWKNRNKLQEQQVWNLSNFHNVSKPWQTFGVRHLNNEKMIKDQMNENNCSRRKKFVSSSHPYNNFRGSTTNSGVFLAPNNNANRSSSCNNNNTMRNTIKMIPKFEKCDMETAQASSFQQDQNDWHKTFDWRFQNENVPHQQEEQQQRYSIIPNHLEDCALSNDKLNDENIKATGKSVVAKEEIPSTNICDEMNIVVVDDEDEDDDDQQGQQDKKRHGRVQSVKFLSDDNSTAMPNSIAGGNGGVRTGKSATVAFIDIRSAAKALRAVHSMAGQPLQITYHEPVPPRSILPTEHSSPSEVASATANETNTNSVSTLATGNPIASVSGSGISNGPNSNVSSPVIYRQQRFPVQHGAPDNSSHCFSRGRGDGHGFHGHLRGRREHRHPYHNNRHSFPGDRNYRMSWGYPNEGRFAPPAHSDVDERTSGPPSSHPPQNENNSKGSNRRPDSPASSVSSRHLPSKRHKSRSDRGSSGSSDRGSRGSSGGSGSRRSSCSTSVSSGRSRSPAPAHHGSSGHYSNSRGGSPGSRFQQNSYSRQRYSRSRLISHPADSRVRHSSRSPAATPSSSASSSPSPSRKIAAAPHSPSHSPSSAKSYSPSRSLNNQSGHHHHHHRRTPNSAELHSAIKIRNLPIRSSDTSLKDGLYHEYKKHGKVSWVRVIGSGSERFAIVCFKSSEHATRAVALSQDKQFFGNKIQVSAYYNSRGDEQLGGTEEDNRGLGDDEPTSFPTRTVLITGLDPIITPIELKAAFDQYGDIVTIDIRKQGASTHAVCEFVDIASAIRAQWGRHVFKAREARISFFRAPPSSSLLLDGTDGVNEKQITGHCSQYGAITRVIMDTGRILALVQFEEISSAQTAIRELRSWVIKSKHLHVDFASPECIRMFLERIAGRGVIRSGNSSPPNLRVSTTPPLSIGGIALKEGIRRSNRRFTECSDERKSPYNPYNRHANDVDFEGTKPITQLRMLDDTTSPESACSAQLRQGEVGNVISGENSVIGGMGYRRHGGGFTSPVSPDPEHLGVDDNLSSEIGGKSDHCSKIDLSCHETDSAIVTSSSDVILIENDINPNHDSSSMNGDEKHNNFESVRITSHASCKSKVVIATVDGVSSTSPEPKTLETVRKSPDPGIGMVESTPRIIGDPHIITTGLVDPRKKANDSKIRRTSADSGSNAIQSTVFGGGQHRTSNNSSGSSVPSIYASNVIHVNANINHCNHVVSEGGEESDDRPGTPLCDENPESFVTTENNNMTIKLPSRTISHSSSKVDQPLSLPLPEFALQQRYSHYNNNNNNSLQHGRHNSVIPSRDSLFAMRMNRSSSDTNIIKSPIKSPLYDSGTSVMNSLASECDIFSPVVESKTISDRHSNTLILLSSSKSSTNRNNINSWNVVDELSVSGDPEGHHSKHKEQVVNSPCIEIVDDDDDDDVQHDKTLNSKEEHGSSSDSESSSSPTGASLEQRIQKFYERYDQWNGIRTTVRSSTVPLHQGAQATLDNLGKSSSSTMNSSLSTGNESSETTSSSGMSRFVRTKHKVLDLDEMRHQPSDIVKSLLAKKSVFDEDSKRLENFGEKYEAKSVNITGANWRLALNRSSSTASTSSTTSSSNASTAQTPSTPMTPMTPTTPNVVTPLTPNPPTSLASCSAPSNNIPSVRNTSPSNAMTLPPTTNTTSAIVSKSQCHPSSNHSGSPSLGKPPAIKDLVVSNPNLPTGNWVSHNNQVNNSGKSVLLTKSPSSSGSSSSSSSSSLSSSSKSTNVVSSLIPLASLKLQTLQTETVNKLPTPSSLTPPVSIPKHLNGNENSNSSSSSPTCTTTTNNNNNTNNTHINSNNNIPSSSVRTTNSNHKSLSIHHNTTTNSVQGSNTSNTNSTSSGNSNIIQSGMHQGIPRMVERSMSLDSKRSLTTQIPICATVSSSAGCSPINGNSASNINNNVSPLTSSSVSGSTLQNDRQSGRRISVDSQSSVMFNEVQLPYSSSRKSSDSLVDNLNCKISSKETSVLTKEKTTKVVLSSTTKDELPNKNVSLIKCETPIMVHQNRPQETTVAVVASVQTPMIVSKDSKKDSRDKKQRRTSGPSTPIQANSSTPGINNNNNSFSSTSAIKPSSSSGKERKDKEKDKDCKKTPTDDSAGAGGSNNVSHPHHSAASVHSSSSSHGKNKSKDKVKEDKDNSGENIPTTPTINPSSTVKDSHSHRKEKDKEVSKMKRRLSSQDSEQAEPKKIKMDKRETQGNREQSPHSHHRSKHSSSTSERRESRDSSSSAKAKEKLDKEKEKDVGKSDGSITATKDKDKDHHHKSKQSSGGSSSSKHHHHGDKSKTSDGHSSSSHSHKPSEVSKKKDKISPGKENSGKSKHSSSSSSHGHGHHGSGGSSSKKESSSKSRSVNSKETKNKDKHGSTAVDSEDENESSMSNVATTEKDKDRDKLKDRGEKHEKRDSTKRDRHKSGGDSSAGLDSLKSSSRSKQEKKKRRRYVIDESDSSDTGDEADEDKQKHHSIFEVFVDEYVSMYDKVKARSNRACKYNAASQKDEPPRKQDKGMKDQSKSKREDKKRSTSVEENSERKSFPNTSSDESSHHHDSDDASKHGIERERDCHREPQSSDEERQVERHDERPENEDQHNHKAGSSSKTSVSKSHQKTKSRSSKGKNGSKQKGSGRSNSGSTPFPSTSTIFFSHSDEDSHTGSPPMTKKIKLKHTAFQASTASSISHQSVDTKSSDDSMSDFDDSNVIISNVTKPSSSKTKFPINNNTSKLNKKLRMADIYSDSDSSVRSNRGSKHTAPLPSSKSKSARDKIGKQKSLDLKKSLFDDSTESSGVEDSTSTTPTTTKKDKDAKDVVPSSKSSKSSKDKEKEKENKSSAQRKKHSHSTSVGSSKSSSSSGKGSRRQRVSSGDTASGEPGSAHLSTGSMKRESVSTIKDILFGSMTPTSCSDVDEKPSIDLHERPKTPTILPTSGSKDYEDTPVSTKSKKSSRSKLRKSSSTATTQFHSSHGSHSSVDDASLDSTLVTPPVTSSSSKTSSSEKKKKKHHRERRSKRTESQDTTTPSSVTSSSTFDQVKVKAEAVDLDSLFNSPVPSPKVAPVVPIKDEVNMTHMENSLLNIDVSRTHFLSSRISPAILDHSVKSKIEKEKFCDLDDDHGGNNNKSMFSTDEDDDDDDNKLKIDINEAIMASDDQHDDRECKDEDADQKQRTEEEEQKLNCLFEQDKAIESIVLLDRKTPPIMVAEEDVNPKDEIPKDETAISQEETEDAVAALLETLEGDDTIHEDNENNLEKSASPPTIRIIEEVPPVGDGENELDQPPAVDIPIPENEKGESWYDTKSPKDLQIDEGADIVVDNPESESSDGGKVSSIVGNDYTTAAGGLSKASEGRSEEDSIKLGQPAISEDLVQEKPSSTTTSRKSSLQQSSDAADDECQNSSSADVYEFHDSDEEKVSETPLAHSKPTVPVPTIKSPSSLGDVSSISTSTTSTTTTITNNLIISTSPQSTLASSHGALHSPVMTPSIGSQSKGMPTVIKSEVLMPLKLTSPPLPLFSASPSASSTFSGGSEPKTSPVIPVIPATTATNRTTVDDTIDEVIRMVQNDTLIEPSTAAHNTLLQKAAFVRARSRSKSKDSQDESVGSSASANGNNLSLSSSPTITPVSSSVNKVLLTKPPESSPRRSNNNTPAPHLPPTSTAPLPMVFLPSNVEHPPTTMATVVVKGEKDSDAVMVSELIDPKTGILIPMMRQSDEYVPMAQQNQQDHQLHQHHLQISQIQSRTAEIISKAMEQRPSVLEKLPLSVQQQQNQHQTFQKAEGLQLQQLQQQQQIMYNQQHQKQLQIQHFQQQQQQSQNLQTIHQQHANSKNVVISNTVVQPKTAVIYTSSGPFIPSKSGFSQQQGIPVAHTPFSGQQQLPSPGSGGAYGGKATGGPQSLPKTTYGYPQQVSPQDMPYHHVPLIRPTDQSMQQQQRTPIASPSLNIRPPLSHATMQSMQNQGVRIPPLPSATTITKVSHGEEQRKSIVQHPNVILTATTAAQPLNISSGSIVRAVVPPPHPHQHSQQPVQIQHAELVRLNQQQPPNRPQDGFGQLQQPRVDIGGNTVVTPSPSPKAGRVPQQHEQTQPQSTQQRMMNHHPMSYDPTLGVLPHGRLPEHYQPSHQQVVYPAHFIPASIAGSMGTGLPPGQQSPYSLRPGVGDKMVQQRDDTRTPELHKGGATLTLVNPERVPPHHIPAHLASPHQAEQRGTESPLVATVYGGQRHLYTPVPAHHQPVAAHRQTFSNPYADFEERPFSNSPSYAQYDPHRVVERERERVEVIPPYPTQVVTRLSSPPPAHSRYIHSMGTEVSERQRPPQVQSPPNSSQVQNQGDSLLMLLQRYPIMWQGLLALKNDNAACQMHFVSGNVNVARDSLPSQPDGTIPPLRISQRMRLEQTQLEGVARKMQMEPEHCMLLALPCGRDHMDVLQQSNNLRHGFITYLQLKQAAGIVNICHPITQQPAYVIHIFPSCDFANENLARIAPDLLNGVADIAHLLIVIATV